MYRGLSPINHREIFENKVNLISKYIVYKFVFVIQVFISIDLTDDKEDEYKQALEKVRAMKDQRQR